MKITVTAEDIKNGRKKNCRMCPLALAATRTYRMAAWVFKNEVFINGVWAVLPSSAKRFVARFDKRKPVQPFTFELPVEKEGA